MGNNIIFLDIDGVLNSVAYYRSRPKPKKYTSFLEREMNEIDPIALNIFKEFVIAYDIKLVLSSSWRILYTYKEMINMFATIGWDNMPLIDSTKDLSEIRGLEIQTWLEENPDYENYVIIDDDGDMTLEQLENNFVQTVHATGLLAEHIEQMKTILKLKNI